MNNFKFIIAFLITFCFINTCSAKQGIVAIVNEDIITDSDVAKRADLIINSSGMQKDKKTLSVVKEHATFTLIDEKLIANEAAKLNISSDDRDINFAIQSLADKNGIKKSELRAQMKKSGIDEKELRKQLSHQLLWNKIIHSRIEPRINVSEKELQEHKDSILAFFKSQKEKDAKEVSISEIIIYFDNDKQTQAKSLKLAKNIYSQLEKGKNFDKLARQFSQSSTSKYGGKVGWLYASQIRPELVHILKILQKNQFSQPIILEDNVRIIRLDDRRGFKKLTEDEISDNNIISVMKNKKLEIQMQAYLRKLRRDSYINIKS